jgi:hypothetical protein
MASARALQKGEIGTEDEPGLKILPAIVAADLIDVRPSFEQDTEGFFIVLLNGFLKWITLNIT